MIDRLWPDRPRTWRAALDLAVPSLTYALRLTFTAVAAFVLTRELTDTSDLTGALSALLVTQATASSSIKYGLIRTGAVLIGVTIAVTIASSMGLHWWSLALAIFSALIVARLLRLGDATLEVAISAMLILQSASIVLVGQEIMPAWQRLSMTLIGTGVGLAVMLVLPPRIPWKLASAQVRGVGRAMERPLRTAATALREGPVTKAKAKLWLDGALAVSTPLSRASRTITKVSDVRKWNFQAIGVADVVPILRSGLDTLERCLLAVRAMLLVIERDAPNEGSDDGYGAEIRGELATAFSMLGDTIFSFSALVQAEALGRPGHAEDVFRKHLNNLRGQRQLLADIMIVDPSETRRWLLRGSILSAIDQVLEHLDLQARTRLRERWELSQAGLRLPEGTVGPKVSSSSRRWMARERTAAARADETAQADFLSDAETTQPLPIVRLEGDEGGRRRDHLLALGELASADRTGNFAVVQPDEHVEFPSDETVGELAPRIAQRKWVPRLKFRKSGR